METLFLRPVTPLYFGRPGALPAGEARSGVSWFPPPISAFQGMIRTRLLDEASVFHPRQRVAGLVGEPDSLPDGWQMQGPFPCSAENGSSPVIWLPAPAFLLQPENWQGRTPPALARPMNGTDGVSPASGDLLLDDAVMPFGEQPRLLGNPGAGAEKPVGGWMSSRLLFEVLAGNLDRESWRPADYARDLPPFVRQELKIGLARDKPDEGEGFSLPGRPKEGMLYSLATLRFRERTGLVGWFDGSLVRPLQREALSRGQVVAGKKGGIMTFATLPGADPHWRRIVAGDHLRVTEPAREEMVWVVLLSSGRWHYGRKRDDNGRLMATAEEMLAGAAPGLRRVEVLGMLCPRLDWLGGFSLARRRPRPAEAWFAPGTSLLVRVEAAENQDAMALIRARWNSRCVLAPEEKRPFGYGHILAAPFHEESQEDKEDNG
ncbi:MAG TPA: hypothetical protein ENK27_12145 [Desulfobulbus sp.]|nr:hypothetical protein [Desulfobulbus sp.]